MFYGNLKQGTIAGLLMIHFIYLMIDNIPWLFILTQLITKNIESIQFDAIYFEEYTKLVNGVCYI